jgi:Flp pilus assembly protein TadG
VTRPAPHPSGTDESTEDGSAVVEFVFVAVVVLVPLLYLVLAASLLQRNAFAVTQAAREAGRAFATADDEEAGLARAGHAVEVALADQGLDPAGAAVRWVVAGAGCGGSASVPTLEPGAEFTVCVVRSFRLPAVPGYLDAGANTVSGQFTVHVDDFRSSP